MCVPGAATAEIVAGPSLLDSASAAAAIGAVAAAAAVAAACAAGAAATAAAMIQPPYLSLLPISMLPLPWLSLLLLLLPSLSWPPASAAAAAAGAAAAAASAAATYAVTALPLLLQPLPLPQQRPATTESQPDLSGPSYARRRRKRRGAGHSAGTLAPTRNPRTSLSFGSSKYQAGPSTARTSATDFDGFTS